jgi:hypothetical protein
MTSLRLAHSKTLPVRTKLSIVPFRMCPIGSLESYRTQRLQKQIARLVAEQPVAAAVVEHWIACMFEESDEADRSDEAATP